MEIVSYIEGAARLAFNWDNTRPKEGAPLALFISFIKDAYGFEEAGLSPNAAQLGIQAPYFKQGIFIHNGTPRGISGVEVIPEGLMATCVKTEIAEAFIVDLFKKLAAEFGHSAPKIHTISYQSAIVTDFGFDLSSTLAPWASVAAKVKELRGVNSAQYEPMSIRFLTLESGDPNVDTQMVFEKRFPGPLDKFYFYSLAPLSTSNHEALLSYVEKTFGQTRK